MTGTYIEDAMEAISSPQKRALILGGGGFIGGHLAKSLKDKGWWVHSVDIKPVTHWYQQNCNAYHSMLDLREQSSFQRLSTKWDRIYNLGCMMGGMPFVHSNHAACSESVLINANALRWIDQNKIALENYFYSSSACVYGANDQVNTKVSLAESMAEYGGPPERSYGHEKLFSEILCQDFREDRGIPCTVVRYHNIFGAYGTYDGGKEKAPAALCRKIARAKLLGQAEIEMIGPGTQTRSFLHIDECLEGMERLITAKVAGPINLGSDEAISIRDLAFLIADIAGHKITIKSVPGAIGVNGRNSDNTLIKATIGWSPTATLRSGLEKTYPWIEECVRYDLIREGKI